jgi:hypothetical protein
VVRPEERLETVRFGAFRHRELIGVRHALLGLDLDGEAHGDSCMRRQSLTLTE